MVPYPINTFALKYFKIKLYIYDLKYLNKLDLTQFLYIGMDILYLFLL